MHTWSLINEKRLILDINRSVGLELTLDDFQKVSDGVPFLADLKPSGKYVMEDVHKVQICLTHSLQVT